MCGRRSAAPLNKRQCQERDLGLPVSCSAGPETSRESSGVRRNDQRRHLENAQSVRFGPRSNTNKQNQKETKVNRRIQGGSHKS